MLIAKDVMTSPVVAGRPDSTVGEVADLLVSHGISAVPVIDRGALLGIVSEGDLIRRAEIGFCRKYLNFPGTFPPTPHPVIVN